MDKFIKYNSKSELHRELTSILLLATEDSNDFYCFCDKFYETRSKCDLCALCEFLFDENNLMDGLSPKKFLQLNYNNRLKLEEFANKILPFFKRIQLNDARALEFFHKEYEWSLKDYSEGKTFAMTLDQIIESDMDLVKNNPQLFDKDFLKKNN